MALKIVVNKLQDEALLNPVEITCLYTISVKDNIVSVGVRQSKAGKESRENLANLKRVGFKFENPTVTVSVGQIKPTEVLEGFLDAKILEEIFAMDLDHIVSAEII
jgi:hypothetical protein